VSKFQANMFNAIYAWNKIITMCVILWIC